MHELGNGNYMIEMLISQSDDLVISAQHEELPDSFIIEIEAAKVDHLVNEFGQQYDVMANHLKIMNKRMVLLNPVSLSLIQFKFNDLLIFHRNLLQINLINYLHNNKRQPNHRSLPQVNNKNQWWAQPSKSCQRKQLKRLSKMHNRTNN